MAQALRLGVTGHRWFDDVDGVVSRLDEVLDDLADDHRPFEVWSALAEGADRLVVERARRREGTSLVAVLPVHVDDYADDFASAESREEFRALVDSASSVRVTGPDATGTRESAYERAGLAVADAVDVLIAIWDGAPARGQGGTGAIVASTERRVGIDTIVIPVTRSAAPS